MQIRLAVVLYSIQVLLFLRKDLLYKRVWLFADYWYSSCLYAGM